MADIQVVAVVSAYNEEESVAATVRALQALPQIDRIVVVDDASNDRTRQKAQETQAEVVSLEKNLGKGGALNFVLRNLSFDVLVMIDADLGSCAVETAKFLGPVLDGSLDMAIADFPRAKIAGGFGVVKSLGRWAIKQLGGLPVNEPLSGQRAFTRELWERVGRLEDGFGAEVGLTIDAARAGFRVGEIETQMTHRETGRDFRGFVHRGKQFTDVLKVVLRRL